MAYVNLNDFYLIKGESFLSMYQFNTMTATHYFCGVCGIYTHHFPRTQKDTVAINISCATVDEETLGSIVVHSIDGASLS